MAERPSIRCMVVDDDRDGAEVLGEFLKVLGVDVRVVYSGQQAIDLAAEFQPQLVVLDLEMPGIDGFESCRRLRQQPWSRDAVFVAYTGMPATRAMLAAAGFDQLVAKGDWPVVFETFLKDLAR